MGEMAKIGKETFAELRKGPLSGLEPAAEEILRTRLEVHWDDAVRPLSQLYAQRADFEDGLRRLLEIVARGYAERSPELRWLDLKRSAEPGWFQKSEMIGYVCYTERFAGNLRGALAKIPYLLELGVTYLHLMPLLSPRPGENDGGYAVADYRTVHPALGTLDDLAVLTRELRAHGISLCTDLVCNHTAREHLWAEKALAGDKEYQDYYLMFPDRHLPDRYEETLVEVFPTFAPGSFTFLPDIRRWVWTTFHDYQWDLDYKNPAVFAEMLSNILFLANLGVEIVRLDAVAFMWKRLGTDCQNQPEAHLILQAFRALSRIAAPGVLLKAEAIVPPRFLVPYLGRGVAADKECELAYHNILMVLLWSSLAESKVTLMTHALQQLPSIPSGTSWVTYVRCHDDVGWAITDEDAAAVALDAHLHRRFLADFYSGRFAGSFARGGTFQANPKTADRRTNGTLASLAGLETALESGDPRELELAIARIHLLHAMIFAFGGIPLIYMGDEIGLVNDMTYLDDPELADDARWMHRPRMDWEKAADRHRPDTVTGRVYAGIVKLVEARRRTFAFHAQAAARAVWTQNDHVAGILRASPRGRILVLGNFSPDFQTVPGYRLAELGCRPPFYDRLHDHQLDPHRSDVELPPYGSVWLEPGHAGSQSV